MKKILKILFGCAITVAKIYSIKDKKGKAYIEKLVLRPKKHKSLTEDSIVGSQIHVGRKGKDEQYMANVKSKIRNYKKEQKIKNAQKRAKKN